MNLHLHRIAGETICCSANPAWAMAILPDYTPSVSCYVELPFTLPSFYFPLSLRYYDTTTQEHQMKTKSQMSKSTEMEMKMERKGQLRCLSFSFFSRPPRKVKTLHFIYFIRVTMWRKSKNQSVNWGKKKREKKKCRENENQSGRTFFVLRTKRRDGIEEIRKSITRRWLLTPHALILNRYLINVLKGWLSWVWAILQWSGWHYFKRLAAVCSVKPAFCHPSLTLNALPKGQSKGEQIWQINKVISWNRGNYIFEYQ